MAKKTVAAEDVNKDAELQSTETTPNAKSSKKKFAVLGGAAALAGVLLAVGLAGGIKTSNPDVTTDPQGNIVYTGEAKTNKGKVEQFFAKHMAAGHAVTITPTEMVAVDVKTQKIVGKQSLYGGYIDTQTGTWSLSAPKKETPKPQPTESSKKKN